MAYPSRIHVTGNAGAGKTLLAHRIGQTLGLPVFALDSIVWRPGWQKTPGDERNVLELALIQQPAWVIDGVSLQVRQAADWVIYLDVPRHVCAWRGIRRSLRYFHRTRPELPASCPEWRIVPRLLGIIWRFPANAGMAIAWEAAHDANKYSVIGGSRDLAAVLACAPAI